MYVSIVVIGTVQTYISVRIDSVKVTRLTVWVKRIPMHVSYIT